VKQLLNTLYVTTQGTYLAKDGEAVAVRFEQETRLHVPLQNLNSIVCFGQVQVSPFLMALCAERGVSLAFLTEHGRFLARVQGPVSGNVLLRREQYRQADNGPRAALIVRSIVAAKIANSRSFLLRALRERGEDSGAGELREAERRLAHLLGQLRDEGTPIDTLRGIEGNAARVYFEVFDHLLIQQKEDFCFHSRSRRPPLDNMNALLSFLYTLLRHDVAASLEVVGLDPAVGFLHCDRPGRPSLALDLMEEMRPVIADRLAVSLVNLRQLKGTDFSRMESGAVTMTETGRKTVLVAYQKRKQEEILHPFLGERMSVGLLFHAQALLLARHLRGDLDAYPPFTAKS
jgi:CRISPR-associated protein Cas1